MIFDITNIDKVKLIQSMYKFARGGTEPLTDDECRDLLKPFSGTIAAKRPGQYFIIDYHNGAAFKLWFHIKNNGRIITYADGYDYRNGNYRLFEMFLTHFRLSEILIVDKRDRGRNPPSRVEEDMKHFKSLLKTAKKDRNNLGIYWRLEECLIEPEMKRFRVLKALIKGNNSYFPKAQMLLQA